MRLLSLQCLFIGCLKSCFFFIKLFSSFILPCVGIFFYFFNLISILFLKFFCLLFIYIFKSLSNLARFFINPMLDFCFYITISIINIFYLTFMIRDQGPNLPSKSRNLRTLLLIHRFQLCHLARQSLIRLFQLDQLFPFQIALQHHLDLLGQSRIL